VENQQKQNFATTSTVADQHENSDKVYSDVTGELEEDNCFNQKLLAERLWSFTTTIINTHITQTKD
jgi:hypothetical protein